MKVKLIIKYIRMIWFMGISIILKFSKYLPVNKFKIINTLINPTFFFVLILFNIHMNF